MTKKWAHKFNEYDVCTYCHRAKAVLYNEDGTCLERLAEELALQPVPAGPSQAEIVCRLIEGDMHSFSTRPCQTCRSITELVGRPFGCSKKALTQTQKDG